MPIANDADLLRRGYAAWFREAGRKGYVASQPNSALSGVEEAGGKKYVVLRNIRGLMVAYRVRNDGKLKALRRVPAELRDE